MTKRVLDYSREPRPRSRLRVVGDWLLIVLMLPFAIVGLLTRPRRW